MPICEADPWRFQYFEHIDCPPDVRISTEDPDSWEWFPRTSLDLRQACGSLVTGPAGRAARCDAAVVPGVLQADHEPARHGHRQPGDRLGRGVQGGTDRRTLLVHAADRCACQHRCGAGGRRTALVAAHHGRHADRAARSIIGSSTPKRCRRSRTGAAHGRARHLRGYTGMVNFETIGGRIIEAHLRFADQWPDLYGARLGGGAWCVLHVTGDWDYAGRQSHRRIQRGAVRATWPTLSPPARGADRTKCWPFRAYPACRSPFTRTRRRSTTPCRPGGFRLAIVNSTSLSAGEAGREKLREALLSG